MITKSPFVSLYIRVKCNTFRSTNQNVQIYIDFRRSYTLRSRGEYYKGTCNLFLITILYKVTAEEKVDMKKASDDNSGKPKEQGPGGPPPAGGKMGGKKEKQKQLFGFV